jgi:hypothetical protein
MNYRFKPTPIYHGQGVLYYGIENEYDFTYDTYKKSTDALRKWRVEDDLRYFVHDGSLNWGVEMVFNPMTFDYFSKLEDVIPPHVENEGDDTAGCHVHMSKDAFTTFHMYKFLNFLTEHQKALAPIFKREVGWTSPVNGKMYCEPLPISAKQAARDRNGNRKYWWINLKNTATLEIRIFKACKTSNEMREIVQFLDALYYYTKDNSVSLITFTGFLDTLGTKEYRHVAGVFNVNTLHSKNVNSNISRKGGK